MTNRKKRTTKNISLSSQDIKQSSEMNDEELKVLNDKIYSAVNDLELQKTLNKYLKDKANSNNVIQRDLGILKNHIIEYMDSFLLFGYTFDGERIIMQNFDKAKDRDAIMEFLKTIFFRQQQDNFLDE